MNIKIEKIPYDKKLILNNLMELYNYDFSEFEDEDVNDFGLFGYQYIDHYWTEEGRYPYIIKVDDKIAGFALVRTIPSNDFGIKQYLMAEFFVMKKYRKKSVGKKVAMEIFDTHKGEWRVSQIKGNKPAQEFWRKVIGEYSEGNFRDINEEDGRTKQIFNSKGIII